MGAQRRGRVPQTRQFRLGSRGVDFVVADLMQEHDRPAFPAPELWDQVMQALWCAGKNWPLAERANGVVFAQRDASSLARTASPISEVETEVTPSAAKRSAVRTPSASTASTAASNRSASAP